MQVVSNIRYSQQAGDDGFGDLYLPKQPQGAKVVLLIHGGAWKSMDRVRFNAVAAWLAECGYAVFNIDYRLLPAADYPACEVDCMDAATFLMDAGHEAMVQLDRKQIVVAGASSGGHLALMVGMKLPVSQVAGIINISGPTDLTAPEVAGLMKFSGMFAGRDDIDEQLKNASPVYLSNDTLPPLLTLHCRKDDVVDFEQAKRIEALWDQKQAVFQALYYHGTHEQSHNIWIKEQPSPDLLPALENTIQSFLKSYLG